MRFQPAFFRVTLREIDRIVHQKSTRNLLLFIPVCVFLLLSFIYVKGILHDIPIAVYDKDNTELSRTIVRFIEASPETKVVRYLNSSDDAKSIFLENNNIEAIYEIPKGLSDDIMSGKSSKIGVYTNSSNIIFGNTIYKEAEDVVNTVNAGILIETFVKQGMTEEQAMNLAPPIRVDAKPLFNPNYNYLYYLVPGLMTVLLQMIIFFVAARAINSEFNNNTYSELLRTAKGKLLNILFGKAFAYLTMGLLILLFILGIIYPLFGIPINGNLLLILGFFILFLCAVIFLGLMLSAIVKDEILALDIAFFYNSPAFVFSGFTFPIFAMPLFDKFYAQFIPYTHFLYGFFKLFQMNTPARYARPEILVLLLFVLVGFVGSLVALSIRTKKFELRSTS